MRKLALFILFITLNINLPAESILKENTEKGKEANHSNELISASVLDSIPERMITTSVIVGEIVILFLLLYYWKRTRTEAKVKNNSVYKRNIQAIRDERIKPYYKNDLSAKRKLLQKQKSLKSLDGTSITNKAKKMSISKGELFLAARINQLQNIYNER